MECNHESTALDPVDHLSNYNAWLLETDYIRNATRIAQQLLPNCFLRCNFVLLKRAKVGSGTPWHQDEAYFDPRFEHATLTFWMPLQDVGPKDGCMIYVPGSPRWGCSNIEACMGIRMHILLSARSTLIRISVTPFLSPGLLLHGRKHLICLPQLSTLSLAFILTSDATDLIATPRKATLTWQRFAAMSACYLHGGALRAPGAKNSQAPLAYYIGLSVLCERRGRLPYGSHSLAE